MTSLREERLEGAAVFLGARRTPPTPPHWRGVLVVGFGVDQVGRIHQPGRQPPRPYRVQPLGCFGDVDGRRGAFGERRQVATTPAPTPLWVWRRVSVVGPALRAGRSRWCWNHSRISRHAIMKLLTTRGEVEAAVALVSVLGRERIAIGGASRGRGCGPHHSCGQGCGGHQYSRLHVGIPFLWKTTALCRRWLQR